MDVALAVPGRAQPAERRGCARRARAGRRRRARTPSACSPEFRGAGRRFEQRGEAGGVARLRRLRAQPDGGRGGDRGRARAGDGRPRARRSSSRTSTRARATRAASSRARWRPPTPSCVTDIYAAREEPVAGVDGKARRRRARGARGPACASRWTPALEDGARCLARRARPGDVVLTLGAGDVDRAAPLLLEALRVTVEEGVALSRLTTIGTGGPARAFARPETLAELEEALALGGRARAARSRRSASARTCSSPTRASTRSSCKLAGELAAVEVDGERLVAGGGAANAVCLHRARAAGLGGFEFACAIPGTVGGGVWMNAGAYGSDFARVLDRALVVERRGARWLTPDELGLAYRHSALRHGAGRRAGRAAARAAAGRRDQGDGRRAAGAAEGGAADEQAHVRQRLQEPGARAHAPAGCSRRAG